MCTKILRTVVRETALTEVTAGAESRQDEVSNSSWSGGAQPQTSKVKASGFRNLFKLFDLLPSLGESGSSSCLVTAGSADYFVSRILNIPFHGERSLLTTNAHK